MEIQRNVPGTTRPKPKTRPAQSEQDATPQWVEDRVQVSTRRTAGVAAAVGTVGAGVAGALLGLDLVPAIATSLASGALVGGLGLLLARKRGVHQAEQLMGRHQEAVEAQLGGDDFEVQDFGKARTYTKDDKVVIDFKPSGTIAVVDGAGVKMKYQVEAEGFGSGKMLADWNKDVPLTSLELFDEFGQPKEDAPSNTPKAQKARTVIVEDGVLSLSNVRYDRTVGWGRDVDESYDLRTGDVESKWISIKDGKTERYDLDWRRLTDRYENPNNAPYNDTPREDRYLGGGVYSSKFENVSDLHYESLELKPEIFGPMEPWTRVPDLS